jgi:hypothetical protein
VRSRRAGNRGKLLPELIPRPPDMLQPPVLESVLTCPTCRATTTELMPLDACVYFHECISCHSLIRPEAGDCCVFCSYGSVKCPPIQLAGKCCTDATRPSNL